MNKVALVTGSSKGIGKAIVKKLASQNYDVVINYNNSEQYAYELGKEIRSSLIIKCDISNEEEVKKMIDQIISKFGHLDILINNAAIEINTEYENKNVTDFKNILNTNLIGTFLVSKYVGDLMYKNKYGKIVNITSNNTINSYDPTTLEYDASKAGIVSITHNLAVEYAPYVNVNAVAPGWILSEKVKALNNDLDGMLEKEESKKIFAGRFGKPEEVANLVSFLVSDEANYINNEIIKIDGGTR